MTQAGAQRRSATVHGPVRTRERLPAPGGRHDRERGPEEERVQRSDEDERAAREVRRPADAVDREDDGGADGASCPAMTPRARAADATSAAASRAGERIEKKEDDREPAFKGSEHAAVKRPRRGAP